MVIGICDDNREDAIRIQQEVCKCLKLFGEEKTITMISEDGRKLLENCRTKDGKSDFFGSGNARVQWI